MNEEILFPFIGVNVEEEPFEYLLLEVGDSCAKIATYDWLVNRTFLHGGDRVELYIPTQLTEEFRFQGHLSATVRSSYRENAMNADIYEVSFAHSLTQKTPQPSGHMSDYIFHIPVSDNPLKLALDLIKDVVLLKEGIIIYFNHLAPYFSRITRPSQSDYTALRALLFTDVKKHIYSHKMQLEKIHANLSEIKKFSHLSHYLDLERLRSLMESEIHVSVYKIAFAPKDIESDKIDLLEKEERREYMYLLYLKAIKSLEKRIYIDYNHIVLIYVKSLLAAAEVEV